MQGRVLTSRYRLRWMAYSLCWGLAFSHFENQAWAQTEVINNSNALSTLDVPNEGAIASLVLPPQHLSIKVNIPATRLDLYVDGQFYHSYKVAVGMNRYPTPETELTLSRIEWNPSWYPPDSEWAEGESITPPGPNNPLGIVKLPMQNGLMFHGTNKPASVGRASSHGCMRMQEDEVRDLAWQIQSRYSVKNDPALLQTYAKNRRRTYVVPLIEPIPVQIEYQQAELRGDRLLLHPNRYGKAGFTQSLQALLSAYPDIHLDAEAIKRLDKLRQKQSVELSITELKDVMAPKTNQVTMRQSEAGI